MHNFEQSMGEMVPSKVQDILRRIVPWAVESNVGKTKFRSNYKGVRGRIGIVGGARDYAGAPYFASISTMKLGADLAYVICSRSASQVIKNYSPDLIVTPILDIADDKEFLNEMECLFTRMHALVIGPGLGRETLMQSRAKLIIKEARSRSLPLVLDADSLLLINEDPSIIKSYSKALLTPNRVELQRMLDSLYAPEIFDLRNMDTNKISKLVRRCSKDLQVSILAKGMVDICAEPDGFELRTDKDLGSNRRCGGQGDILSGVAGVFLHWLIQANKELESQKNIMKNVVAWAGYLAAVLTRHTNELAFTQFKSGMLTSDMVEKVNNAFESLLEGRKEVNVHISEGTKHTQISIAKYSSALTQDEINRYRRQMIMGEFGPERQLKLKQASVLIIGAGGLGCPSAVYVGAGGIGRIGIVDDDRVESSNLHRQILHNMSKVDMLKTESIKEAIQEINPNVEMDTHSVRLTRFNAVQLVEKYDIVIDATDNLLSRYMINDACVVAKKPLVSGAALKMDGQLSVYNYDEETPCFRCLFPVPPPLNAVGSCTDNGVLGVIPGIIGVQQALEAIKIASGLRPAFAGKMLLFDGQLGLFRHITLSKRKADCESCGSSSKLGRELIDYEDFCGSVSCEKSQTTTKSYDILASHERISVEEYLTILDSGKPHVLVDVRPLAQSNISRFEHALQIPIVHMIENPEKSRTIIEEELKSKDTKQIYIICRKGIASQRGTRMIQDLLQKQDIVVRDIMGGMTGWAARIDGSYSCI